MSGTGHPPATERDLLVDCLRRLNRAGISCMLTGSTVSNDWGIPRTTHNLDFVTQLPPSDTPKLIEAFRGDFYLDEAAIRAAYQPPFQFNAIDARLPFKVVFWLLKLKLFEWGMFVRRVRTVVLGETAWILPAPKT